MKLSINFPRLKQHNKRSSVGPQNKTAYASDFSERASNTRVSSFLSSSQGKRPLSLDASACVGNDAKLEFFDTYLNLPLISERNRHEHLEDTPNVAYLGGIEKIHMRPQPFGIVRRKGPNTFIDIHMYSMGDTFAEAFSKGVKQYKEVTTLNLKANRLTDSGCAKILTEMCAKKLKSVTLSENKLGGKSTEQLIKIVSLNETKLRTLDLESVGMSERFVSELCRVLADNKVLHNLNLAKNNLGLITCIALKELLRYNSTLRHLDLHWNNIRLDGAVQFFEGLGQNDGLRVLDLSWNSLGRDTSLECAKVLGHCFKLNSTLQHLDLSYNFFTLAECEVLAERIKDNHNIIGLHMTGNEGYVDPQGFIVPYSASFSNSQEGHFFNRILDKSKYSRRHQQYNNCWICEKWLEVKFEWKASEGNSEPNYVHLIIDKFLPTPLKKQMQVQKVETSSVTRVVPPGNVMFYFSNHMSAFTAKSWETRVLESPVPAAGTLREVSVVNFMASAGEVCNLKDLFDSRARVSFEDSTRTGPEYEKIPWTSAISIFRNYVETTEESITECFEFDWSNSKLQTFIKDEGFRQQAKEMLRERYPPMLEAFKTLSALSGNEVFAIGSNAFNDFLNQCKAFDGMFSTSDLGVNWNTANSNKTQGGNSGSGLCRFEFLEIIVRIAQDRYVRNKVCPNIIEAIVRLFSEHLQVVLEKYDTCDWRNTMFMTEEIDYLLRAYRPLLENVYKKYGAREIVPGQELSMSLSEFRRVCIEAKIVNSEFTSREIDMCFSKSMAIQSDYLNSTRHLEMNFYEFLEAISRAANELSGENLKAKIESIMPNLLSICSEKFKQGFQYPNDETYFHMMYRVKQ